MNRLITAIVFALVSPVAVCAQDSTSTARRDNVLVSNASSTGTTVRRLAKLTGAPSTAVIAGTSDTDGVIGVVTGGAGTSGTATVQTAGQVSCDFDAATVAGDYVSISSTTAGKCHDAGSTYPTSGQVLGRVLSTNGSAGAYDLILTPGVKAGGGITASSTDTLSNKTIALGSNTVSGTTAQFNAALSDNDFATLAGAETLTNKALTTPTIASFANANHDHTNSAGGGQLNASSVFSAGQVPAARGGLGVDASGCTGAYLWASGTPTCTSTSGTSTFARTNGPTFVAPVLGAATATSVNGNTFTTGTYTLTGTAGKTLTFSNTLTLAGTDSTTMTFPSTSTTVGGLSITQSWTGVNTFGSGSGAPVIIDGGSTQNVLVYRQAGTDIGALSTNAGLVGVNGRGASWYDGGSLASPGNMKARVTGGSGSSSGFFVASDSAGFCFHSAASIAGSPDTCLYRNAAGIVEVNNGTAGTFRDLKVRQHYVDQTITAGGTTGNQTINKGAATVNFAASATAITVTNSLVTTSSTIYAMARTNDSTCTVKNVVPGSGSFTINMTAACTAETSVGFLVTN